MLTANAASPNYWFLTAALLAVATLIIHLAFGSPEVMGPLYTSSAPKMTIAITDVIWQQVSVLIAVAAAAFVVAAFRPAWQRPVAVMMGGQFALVTVLFLIYGALWYQSPWPMPQWILFGVMAILAFIGMGRRTRPAVAPEL